MKIEKDIKNCRYLHRIFPSLHDWAEWYNTWTWRQMEINPEDVEKCKAMIKIDDRFLLGFDGRVYELAWQGGWAD